MGDIVSLVEKAAENFDAEKAQTMAPDEDPASSISMTWPSSCRQMQKLGGMGGIMGMMPGMGKMKDQMSAAGMDDKTFARQIAIIGSMTKEERANPDISSTAARSASPPVRAPMRPPSTSFSRCTGRWPT
jgi:signal recognition particle subunit SRP54